MYRILFNVLVFSIVLSHNSLAQGAGNYTSVHFPPSTEEGKLTIGVTFTLWIPEDVQHVRGVIVHQHGCGEGACRGGKTAAYDLHWQALARKWDCALLGPSYEQSQDQSCRLWCDPRNGSATVFLQAMDALAKKTKHPELRSAPWCLWGHSGGGFWSSLMQTLYPKRIVAVWLRSGTAYGYWTAGEIEGPKLSEEVYSVPVMCNPGQKEKEHERFHNAWDGTWAMFQAYRQHGAPIGFAPDPRTSHECGDSRYLAIPFFDACLAQRLPDAGSKNQGLRAVSQQDAWLATPLTSKAVPKAEFTGDAKSAVWLPNRQVALAWEEYVQTGAVSDTSPPPAPFALQATKNNEGGITLHWNCHADYQSGIKQFLVFRNGKQIAVLPGEGKGRFGRPLFQPMSYHDTPEAPLPEMKFADTTTPDEAVVRYHVIAVNSAGLSSKPSPVAKPDK